jgi:hypothetical protein
MPDPEQDSGVPGTAIKSVRKAIPREKKNGNPSEQEAHGLPDVQGSCRKWRVPFFLEQGASKLIDLTVLHFKARTEKYPK